jgi:hypothetical protein
MNFANATILYHSPMKKKGSTLAGVPRRSGEDRSPVGNGAFSQNNQVSQAFIAASIHSPMKGGSLHQFSLVMYFGDGFCLRWH